MKTYSISGINPSKDETYEETCTRMERVLKEILEEKNSSVNAIQTIAFIAMEAPADFYYEASVQFSSVRDFLTNLDDELKLLFRTSCEGHSRYRLDRVNTYLRVQA
jgi:uncharacterized membrane protein YfhO